MKRREIIKLAALATGVAVSAPLASTLLSGCQSPEVDNDADYALQFFNKEEFALVRNLVDLILPKTDSPSATEVGVHRMIDSMVGTAYRPNEKEYYKKVFTTFFQHLSQKNFNSLNAEEKLAQLQTLDTSKEENLKEIRAGFTNLKQQTVAYYLAAKPIGTQFLNYLPVPGEYQPCISVAEAGGKAWAI